MNIVQQNHYSHVSMKKSQGLKFYKLYFKKLTFSFCNLVPDVFLSLWLVT